MKYALLGDVHANLPALEAVLAHAHEQGAAGYWNIGDFVGYGAFPNEVIDRLRALGALSVSGNYDLKVLRFSKKAKKWRRKKRPEKFLAFQWTDAQLTAENRAYLAALPAVRRFTVAGQRVLLTHASLDSNEEYLTPETSTDRLHELVFQAAADILVFGHSHRPFARQVAGAWLVNTGSVGRPDDGDPRACYAILEISDQAVSVDHFRVEYDLERAIAALRQYNLPNAFAEMIRQGRDLDAVMAGTNPDDNN